MLHTTPITIRFADIDAMGHVNNAVYLTYLEHARLLVFLELFPDINWKEQAFILARVEINYIQPILLRDKIIVETQCSRIGNKSFDLSYKIMKMENDNKTEMANGVTVLVGFNYENNCTIPIPEEWKKKLLP